MDLNSIYFIEFKGRLQTEIGSNFEWTWINWTRNIFSNISGLSFKVFENKTKTKMMEKMTKILLME
jgi:hypothetical protein